jgi:small subunit ribosomal protein S4
MRKANCRLCRREGQKLFLKGERCSSPKCPLEKKGAVPPGLHGTRRKRGLSEFGVRLREKQKAKRIYQIKERQFKNYAKVARKEKQATGEALLRLLETRLDNVVLRLGLVPSRRLARQLVAHDHILVNNRKVNIASYQVKPEEVISLTQEALLKIPQVQESLNKKPAMPAWLERKGPVGKMVRFPKREEIPAEVSERLIIEYYSR